MTKFSTNNSAEEHALVTRIANGDKDAFKELLDRHQVAIYRYCLLMVSDKDVAEDMFQDVFFSFYKMCRKGRMINNVRGYLVVTARSRCLDHLEVKSRYVDVDTSPEPLWELDITQGDTREHLRAALQGIPEQYREAFVLFALKEYSYEEIAEMLEVSRHVVKNRIYRAKQSLQKILSPILRDANGGNDS